MPGTCPCQTPNVRSVSSTRRSARRPSGPSTRHTSTASALVRGDGEPAPLRPRHGHPRGRPARSARIEGVAAPDARPDRDRRRDRDGGLSAVRSRSGVDAARRRRLGRRAGRTVGRARAQRRGQDHAAAARGRRDCTRPWARSTCSASGSAGSNLVRAAHPHRDVVGQPRPAGARRRDGWPTWSSARATGCSGAGGSATTPPTPTARTACSTRWACAGSPSARSARCRRASASAR